MKKIFVPFLLVTMLALAVLPAAAGNGPDGGGPGRGPMEPQCTPQPEPYGQGTMTTYRQSSPHGVFAVVGTITTLDATTGTITLTVMRANKLAQPYLSLDITVATDEKTRFLYKETTTSVATVITFDDLQVGDIVSIRGLVAEDVFTASRVTKGAKLTCLTCLP